MTENEIKKHNAHAVDKNVNRHMCKSNNCKNRAHGMQNHVSFNVVYADSSLRFDTHPCCLQILPSWTPFLERPAQRYLPEVLCCRKWIIQSLIPWHTATQWDNKAPYEACLSSKIKMKVENDMSGCLSTVMNSVVLTFSDTMLKPWLLFCNVLLMIVNCMVSACCASISLLEKLSWPIILRHWKQESLPCSWVRPKNKWTIHEPNGQCNSPKMTACLSTIESCYADLTRVIFKSRGRSAHKPQRNGGLLWENGGTDILNCTRFH